MVQVQRKEIEILNLQVKLILVFSKKLNLGTVSQLLR
jgi:hypothetical protein